MSARFQPGKRTEVLYIAKNFISGLTDVAISLFQMDGTTIFSGLIMVEIGTTGVYKHTFNAPTGKATYMVLIDSTSQPKEDAAVFYSGGFDGDPARGGGIGLRRFARIWTKKEKDQLLESIKAMANQIDALIKEKEQLKDIVVIQKDMLDAHKTVLDLGNELKISVEEGSKASVSSIRSLMGELKVIEKNLKKDSDIVQDRLSTVSDEVESRIQIGVTMIDKTFDKEIKRIQSQIEELQEYGRIMVSSASDEAIDAALEDDDEG